MKYLLLLLISLNAFAFDHQHSLFDRILKQHTHKVSQQVLVDYKAIMKVPGLLEQYLVDLDGVTKDEFDKFSRDQQLAFLINLYNAQTIKLIIMNYPVDSIKNLGGLFSSPWGKKFFNLFGKKSTLDTIEHKIIRPQFKEPRIHFAVNCASIGCPSLRQVAFTATKLEEQLEQATKDFLNNRAKNYIKHGILYLSKIFDWYEDDFNGVMGFVSKYKSEWNKSLDIEHLKYDWLLNDYSK